MTDHESVGSALRRSDFFYFLKTVFAELNDGNQPEDELYLELLCNKLQGAVETDAARLLVTIPPRHLKSITASVALSAWLLGKNPAKKVMVACYSDDLSREHTTSFRRVVNADWYKTLFPHTKWSSRKGRDDEIRTTSGGIRRAVTVGGTVTGFGADVIILDDLMKAAAISSDRERERVRDFYRGTILSRLNEKKSGQIIAIQQRLHEDDFAAFLIETGRFEHLNLPAIATCEELYPLRSGRVFSRRIGDALAPSREPLDILEDFRQQMGEFAFSAQYQQDPTPREGALIRISELTFEDEIISCDLMESIIQSWDLAYTLEQRSDFSVCTTWGLYKGRFYLLDLHRAKHGSAALKSVVLKLRNEWQPKVVLLEKCPSGHMIWDHLRVEGESGFILVPPIGDKITRLLAQTDILQSDRVVFPGNAAFAADLKRELMAFPNGQHDDQVDSISQFLNFARSPRGNAIMSPRMTASDVYAQRFGRR